MREQENDGKDEKKMDYKEAAKELWNTGETKIGKHTYRHQVKACEEDNEEYGIDGGRISKLFIFDGETTVASCNREPRAPAARTG